MIYTVTFNPAIDYIVHLPKLNIGDINRADYEQVLRGGKGINVSIVLQNLGISNTALGFIAGFTGQEIIRQLQKSGCYCDFISLPDSFSRINVKIKTTKNETEINGQGPTIPQIAIDKLFSKLSALQENDTLILAGSIPQSLPDTIYELILAHLSTKKIHIVVDATKNLLLNTLKFRPFLIKPNIHELEELFHTSLNTSTEIIQHAQKLQKLGAKNVLISLGKDGAILVDEYNTVHQSTAPEGILINSVGAGDSMIAGFLAGYKQTKDYHQAFLMGIATGSSSAFSSDLATKDEVLKLLDKLT